MEALVSTKALMGLQHSKEELLLQQVNYGNADGICLLHSQGTSLEYVDRDGKTPLMTACLRPELYNVATVLIELGANVNAYRPGSSGGTPLHHAAKKGLDVTVNLLLSSGANPFIANDDCYTALDLAREKLHLNVVHAIENRISLFRGYLRESYTPSILDAIAPQLLTTKIWGVVIPRDARNPTMPSKFQLAIYSYAQDAKPRLIVSLWKCQIEEPKFAHPDPFVVITDKASKVRYKFLSAKGGDKQQLQWFYDACRGISQANGSSRSGTAAFPVPSPQVAVLQAQEQNLLPFNSSSASDVHLTTQSSSSNGWKVSEECTSYKVGGPSTSGPPSKLTGETQFNSLNISARTDATQAAPSDAGVAPSASPVVVEDDTRHYPPIDSSHGASNVAEINPKAEASSGNKASGVCVICLDGPVEGACIPCGHMAGCMRCLREIKEKRWGCPVCRATIKQVIKLYAV